MAMTTLQWQTKRRREQARDAAWCDGRARDLGRLDALLHCSHNPYPKATPQAEQWELGYRAALEVGAR